MTLRKIYYRLSPKLRFTARKIFYLPTDLFELVSGRRQKHVPPKGDIFIGSGDFIQQGKHHLKLLKKHLDLSPDDYVLDIGCGMGRTALPLTSFLSPNSKFEGFDVVKKGIDWCNSKIKKDFPNFNFTYISLNNDLYHKSENQAREYIFPYASNSFDKAFLFSVFTHMQLPEIENYLKEIERVLKPKGVCLATFFIYDESEKEITRLKQFKFPIQKEGCRLMDKKVKSANIAIDRMKLDQMILGTKLYQVKVIEGYWNNGKKKSDNDFQDIVILKK